MFPHGRPEIHKSTKFTDNEYLWLFGTIRIILSSKKCKNWPKIVTLPARVVGLILHVIPFIVKVFVVGAVVVCVVGRIVVCH